MSNLPTTLSDQDPDHTAGHNATNLQVNTNSRPSTVISTTHSSAGAITLDGDSGHIQRFTVGANITSINFSNLVTGLPFLLILEGDGVLARTANVSGINLTKSVPLNSSLAIEPDSIIHISFIKDHNGEYWAPAGVVDYGVASGGGGPISTDIILIDTSVLLLTGIVTSINIPYPATIDGSDHLEVFITSIENTDPGAPTTPAGYTQRYTNTPDVAYRPRLTKLYKTGGTTGSESGALTVSTPSSRFFAMMRVWRNVDLVTPYDVAASAVVHGSTNPNPPSITPVTANAVVTTDVTGNALVATPATISSGYSTVIDQSNIDRAFVMGSKLLATPAAENPGAYIWNAGNSTARTDALRPA